MGTRTFGGFLFVTTCLVSLLVGAAGTTPRAATLDAPAAPAARPTVADVVGTWTGTIRLQGASEPFDGGLIRIGLERDELVVTVGPDERTRYICNRVVMTEQGLKFEAPMPGRDTRLIVYDVRIAGGAMTGTATFVRHGLTAPGQLAFERD